MSGIYGFSLSHPTSASIEQTLGGLRFWNRIYGRDAHEHKLLGNSGIGCHLEHFSDRIAHGALIQESQQRCAVVDALIFNRDELLAGLRMETDRPLSDGELLLRWIEQKGYDALAQVNGDFAGAVFDFETGEWTLFRDHLGIRPLYLYCDDELFAFSTDIRGLLSLAQADARPNELRLFREMIGQNYLSLLETEYANIYFVRPAAVTRVRPSGSGFRVEEQIYWKLRSKRIRLKSDEAYQQELRRLITDSVRRRLDAFPGLIGAELSGGLDSGVIDILINRLGREGRFVSWSPSPDKIPLQQGEDERHVINDVCRQEGISCSYLNGKDQLNLQGFLDRAVPPFFDTPNLGYGADWLRSQGVRGVFTGHGGDEGVSHRCSRLELLVYGEYLSFFRLYWDDLKGIRLRFLKVFKYMWQDIRRLKKKTLAPADETDLNEPLFTEAFRSRMKTVYTHIPFTFAYDPVKYIMQGGTQHRMDNAAYQGAFHGVRYVYPYLDYRVLDYALSIPRVQYLGKQNRRIFREAFRDILPDSLYFLGYKDFASKRGVQRQDNYDELFRKQLETTRSRLDPELWSDILDLEQIMAIKPDIDDNSAADFRIFNKVKLLQKMIMLQNAREKALKWREFDEQNILL